MDRLELNRRSKIMKPLIKSKRFWAGLLATLTGVSLVLTGEKTLSEQLPLIITSAFALIQLIIGVTSTEPIQGFGKK